MPPPARYPNESDREQLRVLSVVWMLYAVLAGAVCLAGLAMIAGGLIAETAGVAAVAATAARDPAWPWSLLGPGISGGFLLFVGSLLAVLGGTFATLRVCVALGLRHQRNRTLCLVGAAVSSISLPIGSLLGIITLVVLLQPHIEYLFAYGLPAGSGVAPPVVG